MVVLGGAVKVITRPAGRAMEITRLLGRVMIVLIFIIPPLPPSTGGYSNRVLISTTPWMKWKSVLYYCTPRVI